MALKNTPEGYGLITRLLHWGMALVIFAMFGLGLWMRTLTYYHPWYKLGPDIHRSIGILLFILLIVRLIWKFINSEPSHAYLPRVERNIAKAVQWIFYGLLLALMPAGYLVSTADGRPIDVFSLFSVPSIYQSKGLEDIAGLAHEYMAYGLMALAVLHVAAAFKHHFIDHDRTLMMMLRGPASRPDHKPPSP